MKVALKLTTKKSKPIAFIISPGESITIGRSKKSCQIIIDDDLASNKHCRISVNRNNLYIEDLDSKNGIFVNGVKIIKQKIYLDDTIKIGESVLFIDIHKLDEQTKKKLEYTGAHIREDGSLTLELDTANRERLKNKTTLHHKRQKPTKNSKTRVRVKEDSKAVSLAINIINYSISIILFVFSIYSFKIFNPSEGHLLFKENTNFLEIIFSENLRGHLLISILVTFGFHVLNTKFKSGSIGERFFKRSK